MCDELIKFRKMPTQIWDTRGFVNRVESSPSHFFMLLNAILHKEMKAGTSHFGIVFAVYNLKHFLYMSFQSSVCDQTTAAFVPTTILFSYQRINQDDYFI